jgi:hypothetical protein
MNGVWRRISSEPAVVTGAVVASVNVVAAFRLRTLVRLRRGRPRRRSQARQPRGTMNEPLSRYDVTVMVGCDGGTRPDPAAFTVAADRAAWGRSASIVSAHLAGQVISVVTVTAPDRYAAVAVARAVVSDALKRQALPSSRSAGHHAHHRAEACRPACA